MAIPERTEPAPAADDGPLAIVCGAGTLPYTVATAVRATGRRVVLFALRGFADAGRVGEFPHHWIALGQAGRFVRLAKSAGCRDVVMIGGVVRPALSQIRLDLTTLRLLPRVIGAFRGGDDHLLSNVGRLFEEHGFRLLAAQTLAPEIVVPEGVLGRVRPSERDRADIAQGLALLEAVGPFDLGQAAVVAQRHSLAVEGAEGTDALLARIVELRSSGRIRSPAGVGVLVKAPKPAQDRRLDLPAIGPPTVAGAARAGLAGIAVVAGSTIIAESERLIALADRGGIFVVGVRSDGTFGG